MTDDDVSGDDMTTHEFSDDDAEAIISGFAPSDPELGAALDDLRSSFAAVEPPAASGALNEFIVRGADPVSVPAGAAAVPVVEPVVDDTPTRRHPVFASISAFAGTALGKICIGASVAAAGVGGASAAGVDTPIDAIFDDDSVVETEPDLLDDDGVELPDIDEPADDEAKRENDDELETLDEDPDDDLDDPDEPDDDLDDELDEADDADDADEYDEGYEDGYEDGVDDTLDDIEDDADESDDADEPDDTDDDADESDADDADESDDTDDESDDADDAEDTDDTDDTDTDDADGSDDTDDESDDTDSDDADDGEDNDDSGDEDGEDDTESDDD